jgi:O-methyltransferase
MKKIILSLIEKMGYEVVKAGTYRFANIDIENDKDFGRLMNQCRPFTMTSVQRLYALNQAVNYISKNKISGDIVECGVWRGGSSMMSALTLLEGKDTARNLYLYDTFEGMSEPTNDDVSMTGALAEKTWQSIDKCDADLNDVQTNMKQTNYPFSKIHFVQGKVEQTIPETIPSSIALLRLDTDWYESTYHELVHLFPRLVTGGVLIIDDYGHWQGARKAVDQYFAEQKTPILLNRIDYTGRIAIKS